MGIWMITEMKLACWINQVHQYWSSWCCWHGFGFWCCLEARRQYRIWPPPYGVCREQVLISGRESPSCGTSTAKGQKDYRSVLSAVLLKWYELLASVTKGVSSNLILAHKLAGSSLTLWRRQQFSGFAKQDKWDKILFEPPQPCCRLVSVTKSNNLDLNLFWTEASKCDQLLVESEV